MNTYLIGGLTIFLGLVFSLILYSYNKKQIISKIFSEEEIYFIRTHYNRKLHYEVYSDKTTTLWIYFFLFSVTVILSFFVPLFSIFYLVISVFYLISEFEQLKIAKAQAFAPSFLRKINCLGLEMQKFQYKLFEESKSNYRDDSGTYALIDPEIFNLPTIYKISFLNKILYLSLSLLILLFSILNYVF